MPRVPVTPTTAILIIKAVLPVHQVQVKSPAHIHLTLCPKFRPNAGSSTRAPCSEPCAIVEPSPIQQSSSISGGFSRVISNISNTASTSVQAVKQSVVTLESIVPVAVKAVVTTANAVVNSQTSKAVQSTGFFTGLLASAIMYTDTGLATPWAASEIFLIPVKLWGLVLVGLGIRKKTRPWGTVYDSVTKQPIDPAFVTARDQSGKVVAEPITDIDGRYGFLLPDGTYYISAKKTNYEFPSKKMVGKSSDELYANLYFGEPVTIKAGEVPRQEHTSRPERLRLERIRQEGTPRHSLSIPGTRNPWP